MHAQYMRNQCLDQLRFFAFFCGLIEESKILEWDKWAKCL